ncbi:MAG: thiolase family protein [Proteobacteria bacterium]|nr:thiolase family protein [Pseudomonadota bacterium]
MSNSRNAVIVSAVRTPVGRGVKGSLAATRPDDLAALVMRAAVERARIDASIIDDVIMGCAMPEAEQGLNVARMAGMIAGLPDTAPGVTVNRFCASGLQAVAMAAQAIVSGMADCIVAGGVESMSMVPMGGNKAAMNLALLDRRPEAYLGMGLTAERLAAKHGISREAQDAFALQSHQRGAAAQEAGRFDDEIVPVPVRVDRCEGTSMTSTTMPFTKDELIRRDTSMEALAKLKPAFLQGGTVTPGNSSPISDGAAALVVMSAERAKALGLEPLATFVTYAVTGVAPEIMGIGPVTAVPKALQRAGLSLTDMNAIELNEAFAAQSLAVLQTLGLDPARVNESGGAIAMGHPLGCSGAKLAVTAIHALRRRGGGHGLVTMCVGGGQGAAGIFRVG